MLNFEMLSIAVLSIIMLWVTILRHRHYAEYMDKLQNLG
jgi:hypothetical protein